MLNKGLDILIDITKNRPSSYALKFIYNTKIQKRYCYSYHNGDDESDYDYGENRNNEFYDDYDNDPTCDD